MKKWIFIFSALITTGTLSAQGIDLGIKAGVNFATITDVSDASNKTGFTGGVFAGIKISDKVGVQGDVLFSQQGAEVDASEVDLNYVTVPLVLKYYLTENFNLHAGPQFGFLIDDNLDPLLEAEPTDVSGVVGIGYDLFFGLRLSGRYNFGFTDILTNDSGKNSVFTLAVEWSFL